jgi:hypothetical protein
VAVAVWPVVLVFDEFELAVLLAVWFAELEPPDTVPPAMFTGTLAFTAF